MATSTAIAGLLVWHAVVPQAASAAIFCETRVGNYHDGGYINEPDTAIYGVRARIEYVNPDLCDSDTTGPSSSNAWVMVRDNRFDSTSAWAQSGWAQDAAGSGYQQGIHEFAQWTLACKSVNSCTGTPWFTAYGNAPQEYAYYVSKYQSGDAHIHMYANGNPLTETNYNPIGIWTNDWINEYMGETFHLGTDMPGTTADKVQFDYIQWYNSFDQTQYVASGDLSLLSDNSTYKNEFYNPSGSGLGIKIWTDR